GTDAVWIAELHERVEQLHARARGLDRDHVGVHRRYRLDDVVELRVAHVGVDLGLVAHARGADAEAAHGPFEILRPVRPTQRQALAQGRLVDLDDADAGRFQVAHLVAQRQGDLQAGLRARLVVAHEGPLQHGHRAGEHALDRTTGQRLRVPGPVHGHRRGPGDVAVDDRRLHAARAVALHPAVAGEGEAVELFAEVLDHVVALELAVHQHVQADALLLAYAAFGLGGDEGLVPFRRQPAGAEVGAGLADLRGLRERADGGGRVQRQAEALLLRLPARREGRLAAVDALLQRCNSRGHVGPVHPRG